LVGPEYIYVEAEWWLVVWWMAGAPSGISAMARVQSILVRLFYIIIPRTKSPISSPPFDFPAYPFFSSTSEGGDA
jgi:hypothetical protein